MGSNLVHALLAQGRHVRVLDDFSTGRRANLDEIAGEIELLQGDLRDPATCARAVAGVDFVLHQGAVPSVSRSVSDPRLNHDANATATLNMLIAARDAGVKRFVHASSSSIYGDAPTLPKQEEMAPHAPSRPARWPSWRRRVTCRVFNELYGLETVCLRYFNVFGAAPRPAVTLLGGDSALRHGHAQGERPVIYGDGLQSRDFTFVANNITGQSAGHHVPGVGGQVFNIACGRRYPARSGGSAQPHPERIEPGFARVWRRQALAGGHHPGRDGTGLPCAGRF
ncbi:MAG: NAD-dependent epimerase/dehydratase family protein [Caldilineaceae bacterium]